MKSFLYEIPVSTRSPLEFVDVTADVVKACAKSGVKNGLVNIFTGHTTAAVKINERCERLQHDMKAFLERVVPRGGYCHDEMTVDDRDNGHSHVMSLLLSTSETVPLVDGRLLLGTWQSVFFIELDGPRPNRRVTVRVIGE